LVVTEAACSLEVTECITEHSPDVILADTELPPAGAIAATIQFLAVDPTVRVVLFSVHPDEQLALRGLEAGASGFLLKDIDMSALARALRSVARGEAAVSRQLSLVMVARLRLLGARLRDMRPVNSPVTDRQWEVLDLMGAGHSVTEISEVLGVSIDTARSHVRMVLRGLGARTPSEAVRVADCLRAGWQAT
jgi:DNA-binding NarL/FixJ family response regulator